MLVTSDRAASVTVSGSAKVGKKTVALSGGTQAVAPGALTSYSVKVPKQLKAALKKLPSRKGITVTFTATTTSATGVVTTDASSVKVPGRKS